MQQLPGKYVAVLFFLVFFSTGGAAVDMHVQQATNGQVHATLNLSQELDAPTTLTVEQAALCNATHCVDTAVESISYTAHPPTVDVFLTAPRTGMYTVRITGETMHTGFSATAPVTVTTRSTVATPTGNVPAAPTNPAVLYFIGGILLFTAVWRHREWFAAASWRQYIGGAASVGTAFLVVAPLLHELAHAAVLNLFQCDHTVTLGFVLRHAVNSVDCALTPVQGFLFLAAGPFANAAGFLFTVLPVVLWPRFRHGFYIALPVGMVFALAFSFFPPHSDVSSMLQAVSLSWPPVLLTGVGLAVLLCGVGTVLWLFQRGVPGRGTPPVDV